MNYLALAKYAVVLLILGFVGYESYGFGKNAQSVTDQKKITALTTQISTEHAVAAKAVIDRDTAVALIEHQAQDALSVDTNSYEQGEHDAKNADAARIASLQSGVSRLRVQLARSNSGSSSVPSTSAGASRGNDSQTADLSPTAAAGIESLASEADDVARQLALAQQVIIEDRKVCNGS